MLCPCKLKELCSRPAGMELTGLRGRDPHTCGDKLISFLESTLSESPAQKMRAIWRVSPVGSLCTQWLPVGEISIAQICSNETENSLVKEGEKNQEQPLILC